MNIQNLVRENIKISRHILVRETNFRLMQAFFSMPTKILLRFNRYPDPYQKALKNRNLN